MAKIPFDIKYRPQIESGEYRVETEAGCPVRIVCWDMVCELPVLGLVLLNDEKAEEMAVGFTNEGTNLLGEPLYDKLLIVTPEEKLTPFEQSLKDRFFYGELAVEESEIKEIASELLFLAREQFIKDGYVIEKKAFRDAVENISDKHRAEMSIEYSIHCKVKDGTRRAVMNWDEFQKVVQKFINIGKAEAVEKYKQSWFNEGKIAGRFEGLTEDEKYQQGVHDGKEEAMKDLPRWERATCELFGTASYVRFVNSQHTIAYVESKINKGDWFIRVADLVKLPGFKED